MYSPGAVLVCDHAAKVLKRLVDCDGPTKAVTHPSTDRAQCAAFVWTFTFDWLLILGYLLTGVTETPVH